MNHLSHNDDISQNVINTTEHEEAIRLIKIFGNYARLVVDEIKKYDKNDSYFWQCVDNEIIKIETSNNKKAQRI